MSRFEGDVMEGKMNRVVALWFEWKELDGAIDDGATDPDVLLYEKASEFVGRFSDLSPMRRRDVLDAIIREECRQEDAERNR